MNRVLVLSATFVFFGSAAHADYVVESRGTWPKDWPKELEPLREDARTLEGPRLPSLHYGIVFKDRETFEAAWPFLLKVKTKGAPIILKRGNNFFLKDGATAGICVHTPPSGTKAVEEWKDEKKANDFWRSTNYIELVVDGKIVDLNRIQLPRDTPIIDQRFEKKKKPASK